MSTARDETVAAVRRFNRFYTQKIGVLDEGHLHSPFSLTEIRVMYELHYGEPPTAADLCRALGLDAGYVSRLLRSFERRGLIRREPSPTDGRQSLLFLTDLGRSTFLPLEETTNGEIGRLLAPLSADAKRSLVAAMDRVRSILDPAPVAAEPWLLRLHRPGDFGWIVQRHAQIYADEYGWDQSFEGMVAEIAAEIIRKFDPRTDCCWIAEKDGANIGSVVLIRKSATVAKLRLLIVDREARGLGVGRRLVAECIRFARRTGYRRIVLWTNSILLSARKIYEAEGFRLTASEEHHSFGKDLIGETWELKL
ncbi:MAG: GNAT family N-acetyltransferase [Alphaproteobacteria bacterium]